MMLAVRDLIVRYGAIQAVRGIGLDIAQGEIVALIGANGAGKTTVARTVAGLLPYQGEIAFENQPLARDVFFQAKRTEPSPLIRRASQ